LPAAGSLDVNIRRRFSRSLQNLTLLYIPLADSWEVYDNSSRKVTLVACGEKGGEPIVVDPAKWQKIFLIPK
jgi:predicted ABC-type ATPase